MGKLTITNYGAIQNPFVLENTKVAQGGFMADMANLASNSIVYKGCPIEADYSTGIAKVLKTAKVIAGGTTTLVRVAKNSLFIVGEHVAKTIGQVAVTINSIDKSGADYDVLTLSAVLTGVTGGDVIFQATGAGSASVAYATPNMLMYNDLDVSSGDLSGVIFSLEINEEVMVYPLNSAMKTDLGALFTFK